MYNDWASIRKTFTDAMKSILSPLLVNTQQMLLNNILKRGLENNKVSQVKAFRLLTQSLRNAAATGLKR